MQRIAVLDGWRGISILMVLSAHLLPLGPSSMHLNETFARMGMAVFFSLSGFLITSLLIVNSDIKSFLIKRFARILPLAWLTLIVTLPFYDASLYVYLSNFLFFSTATPMTLFPATSHFWSLCVEMQFYVFIALLVWTFGKKALYLLPLLCVAITANRVINEVPYAINTYYRVDEILIGATLALGYHHYKMFIPKFSVFSTFTLLIALGLASFPKLEIFNYFRPYVCAFMLATTLNSDSNSITFKILTNRILVYIATISFALYVIHGGLRYTWLGSGDTLQKYLKRPVLLLVTFVMAHFSTFYYESYFQKKVKKYSIRKSQK